MLTVTQEQRVRDALRYGDGELLADVVRNGGRLLEYDDLAQFVEEQPGGFRHVSWRGIQVGGVQVVDKYGRPEVR